MLSDQFYSFPCNILNKSYEKHLWDGSCIAISGNLFSHPNESLYTWNKQVLKGEVYSAWKVMSLNSVFYYYF